MKRALRYVGIAAILGLAAGYLHRHGGEFRLLLEFDFRGLIPIVLTHIAAIAINGLIALRLVREFGVQLRFEEWFGLSALHSMGNYLPLPQAGSMVRGVYLKHAHGLDYTSFVATLAVAYLQFLGIVGVLGLLCMGGWFLSGQPVPWPMVAIFAALASGLLALTHLPWKLPILRSWERMTRGFELLRSRRVFFDLLLLQLALVAVGALGLWLSFYSLGRPIGATASFLLALMASASGVVNITPGNVGVAEAAAWLTATLIETDPNEAVVTYALFRLVSVIPIFTLGPYYLIRLSIPSEEDPGPPTEEG